MLDVNVSAFILDIEGSLIVSDKTGGITIDAHYIFVRSGGSLTADIRTNALTITLSGGLEVPVFGQKVLGVSDGNVSLTGRSVGPSWVQLSANAAAGSSFLRLTESVSLWPVGAEIAVAPSGSGSGGTEVFTIVAVSGSTVTLNGTLRAARSGTVDAYGIDRRAEVAILSRNIVIRGDGSPDEIGAHMMLTGTSAAQISDVLFTNVGQGGQLGRYPFHPHMMGDVTGRVRIESCVVRGSFNRAFTVHGVRGMIVSANVAFDVAGHAFFLEDGVETGNTVQNNLALKVYPQYNMLATDTVPGGFWITNPNNYFTGNVAADVQSGQGFWIEPRLGAFVSSAVPDPMAAPLGSFFGNRAHSVDQYGARVLIKSGTLDGFSAYGCAVSGFIGVTVGAANMSGFLIGSGATAALEVIEAGNMGKGGVFGGTFVSDVPGSFGVIAPGIADGWAIDGSAFRGFSSGAAISTCDHCLWVNSQTQGAAVTHVRRLSFDSSIRLQWAELYRSILRDEDNSIGNGAGDSVPSQLTAHLACPAASYSSKFCGRAVGLSVWGFSDCSIEYESAKVYPVSDPNRTQSIEYGDRFFQYPTEGWAAVLTPASTWAFELSTKDWSPGVQNRGGVNVEIDNLDIGSFIIIRLKASQNYPAWRVSLPDAENFGRQNETFCNRCACPFTNGHLSESDRFLITTDRQASGAERAAHARLHGYARDVLLLGTVCVCALQRCRRGHFANAARHPINMPALRMCRPRARAYRRGARAHLGRRHNRARRVRAVQRRALPERDPVDSWNPLRRRIAAYRRSLTDHRAEHRRLRPISLRPAAHNHPHRHQAALTVRDAHRDWRYLHLPRQLQPLRSPQSSVDPRHRAAGAAHTIHNTNSRRKAIAF